jgi:hypothetical protein
MSSNAATAALAALLLGNPLLRPESIFTFPHAAEPAPALLVLPLTYSASASAPSLSSSLRCNWGRDFFLFIAVLPDAAVVAAVVVLDDDAVDPVVRVGGPGEYMAAAEPGRESGIGKFSGLI